MSEAPSPVKSPVPAMDHSVATVPTSVEPVDPPSHFQRKFCPLTELRHRISALPSPVKSAVATTFQSAEGPVPRSTTLLALPAFMFQTTSCSVLELRHRISSAPSWKKSDELL